MYDCAKPKKKRTTSALIIRKCLFLPRFQTTMSPFS